MVGSLVTLNVAVVTRKTDKIVVLLYCIFINVKVKAKGVAFGRRIFQLRTDQFDAKPDEVDHWTPSSHWCPRCWHWVVDCEDLLDPMPLNTMPWTIAGFKAWLTTARRNAWKFDSNGTACTNLPAGAALAAIFARTHQRDGGTTDDLRVRRRHTRPSSPGASSSRCRRCFRLRRWWSINVAAARSRRLPRRDACAASGGVASGSSTCWLIVGQARRRSTFGLMARTPARSAARASMPT